MSPLRSRIWNGTVLLGGDGETPGWADPWAGGANIGILEPLGALSPGTTNIGAGIYEDRPFPTATITVGPGVSYNSSTNRYTISTTVENVVIPGFVTLTETGVLRNFHIRGPAVEKTGGYLAMVEGPATSGAGLLEWGTIHPNVASAWYDGIGRGITARYVDVAGVIDGVRGFSTSVNGFRGHFEACDFHDSPQFTPDYAYSGGRAQTHNDVVVQLQGNPNGDDEDIYFDGCRGDARHSTTQGNLPATREQISGIMVTPAASQGACHATFTRGWLYGGDYLVNAGSDTVDLYGGSSLTITNTRFERPGTNARGDGRAPTVALAVDSGLTLTAFGNTYIDNGAPVPVTNA